MRICIVHEYFRPYITGGADIFLVALSDYLISKGFEIDVITTHQNNLKHDELSNGIHIHRFKPSPIKLGHMYQFPGVTIPWNYFNYPMISRMKKIMKQADVVHINNIFQLSFSPLRAASSLGKPIVFDVHDYWLTCFKKDLLYRNEPCRKISSLRCADCILSMTTYFGGLIPSYLPLIFVDKILKRKFFKADAAITHSDFARRRIKDFVKVPIQVIPYPYIGKIYRKRRLVKDKIKLLFIGRLIEQKGAHIIPEISQELERMDLDHEFNVIGNGPLFDSLRRRSERFNIKFHGAIYDEKIKRRFFLNSDVILIQSFGEEPFGIVVLESMAHGLPIISTNRGGLGELVRDNGVGLTCEPTAKNIALAIKQLVSDKKTYEKMSKNGYKNIRKFLPIKIFKEYERVYERLV